MSGVTTQSPINIQLDGNYVSFVPATANPPGGGTSGLIVIVGATTDGGVGVPLYASDLRSLKATCGGDPGGAHSAYREALSALNQTGNIIVWRATDGTDLHASFPMTDSAMVPGTVVTITAKNTGSNANGGTGRIDVGSNTSTGSPTVKVTLTYPGSTVPEIWDRIVAYATVGGGFDAPTLIANIVAAINNGTIYRAKSAYWNAAAGASTVAPAYGTTFTPTMLGTDGSNVTSTQLVAAMQAAEGLGADIIILAGNSDQTTVPDVLTFARAELAVPFFTHAAGTTTTQAVSDKIANGNVVPDAGDIIFWPGVADPTLPGVIDQVSPLGFVAGIFSALNPADYGGNKPRLGLPGILNTERSSAPIPSGEQSQLESNGIMWLTNVGDRGNGLWTLKHGMASDGVTQINWTRMKYFLAKAFITIGGPFVGELQSQQPTDPLRNSYRRALNTYLTTLVSGNMIDSFSVVCDLTNNSPTTIAQGLMIADITVVLLSGARIIFNYLQSGANVTITSTAQAAPVAA